MKKLLAITLAVVLGLALSGCKKVEPTSLTYMYSVKVRGTVNFSNGNPASNITVKITASNSPKSDYKVVSGSDGKFSLLLPCKVKADNSLSLSVTDSERGDGKKYSSKSNKTVTLSPGDTSEDLLIELKDGVDI